MFFDTDCDNAVIGSRWIMSPATSVVIHGMTVTLPSLPQEIREIELISRAEMSDEEAGRCSLQYWVETHREEYPRAKRGYRGHHKIQHATHTLHRWPKGNKQDLRREALSMKRNSL